MLIIGLFFNVILYQSLSTAYSFTYITKSTVAFRRSVNKDRLAMSTDTEKLSLTPAETALVLIEYQNEFTTEGGKLYEAVKPCLEANGTMENSKKVLDAARKAGCLVVHVPIEFEKGHREINESPYGILAGVKDGSAFEAKEWNSQICDLMKPAEGEIVVKGKTGLCGFVSTNLDFILRQNRINNVVLGGFLTNCCVESTMRTAYEYGYKVYTMKDCCAATSVDAHNATYEHNFGMFSVPTTSEEIISGMA